MSTAIDRRRAWRELIGEAPPAWAVRLVRVSAIGVLVLPAAVVLLRALCAACDIRGLAVAVGTAVAAVVWVAMFAATEVITRKYPPVPRGR